MDVTIPPSLPLPFSAHAAIITNQSLWQEQTICSSLEKGPILVNFIRNDALYTSPVKLLAWDQNPEISKKKKGGIDWKASKPWTPYYEIKKPELVVLNLGLHVHSDSFFDSLLENVLGYLKEKREADEREGRKAPRVVWRTTAAGHPECWKYERPMEEGEEGKEGGVRYEGVYKERYTWHLTAGMNQRMERRVMDALGEGGREGEVMVLKVHEVSEKRWDGHLAGEGKDCLHYHVPGPADWWSRVFVEVLDEVVPSLPSSVST